MSCCDLFAAVGICEAVQTLFDIRRAEVIAMQA